MKVVVYEITREFLSGISTSLFQEEGRIRMNIWMTF